MSNPGTAAAQSTSTETLTFEQQVNSVVSKATVDEKGNLVLPQTEQVPEEVLYAANLEKRRRDTQGALGKASQQLAVESKMREELEKRVATQTTLTLTPEQTENLAALKLENPDEWRMQMNKLENEAAASVQAELKTLSSETSQQAEISRRAQVLADFNATAAMQITDEVLINDIPPRIAKKLELGEITFEEFLTEAQTYLLAPKKVGGTAVADAPSLGKAGGSSEASLDAKSKQSTTNYSNETY